MVVLNKHAYMVAAARYAAERRDERRRREMAGGAILDLADERTRRMRTDEALGAQTREEEQSSYDLAQDLATFMMNCLYTDDLRDFMQEWKGFLPLAFMKNAAGPADLVLQVTEKPYRDPSFALHQKGVQVFRFGSDVIDRFGVGNPRLTDLAKSLRDGYAIFGSPGPMLFGDRPWSELGRFAQVDYGDHRYLSDRLSSEVLDDMLNWSLSCAIGAEYSPVHKHVLKRDVLAQYR